MAEENNFDDTFVCIPRGLIYEVLERRLNAREAYALLWLFLRANWRQGVVHTSYASLAEELGYEFKDKVNAATKVIRSLKQKGYIDFDRHQGKRGTFPIRITGYLKPERLKELKLRRKEAYSRSAYVSDSTSGGTSPAEDLADFFSFGQKSDVHFTEHDGQFQENAVQRSRSANNDNENGDIDDKEPSPPPKEENRNYGLPRYEPEHIRGRCEAIAKALGEGNLAFTLSACQKYGLDVVEEAYTHTLKRSEKIEIRNLGAFFNTVVQELGEVGLGRRQNYV